MQIFSEKNKNCLCMETAMYIKYFHKTDLNKAGRIFRIKIM
jgi:hypothetical protein